MTGTVTLVSCGSWLIFQKFSGKKKERGGKVIQGGYRIGQICRIETGQREGLGLRFTLKMGKSKFFMLMK